MWGRLLPIRPLSVGEILDTSIRCLRATFLTAATLVLVVQGPYQLVSSLVLNRFFGDLQDPAVVEQMLMDGEAAVELLFQGLTLGTVLSLVGLVLNVLVGAAVVWVYLRTDQGLPATVGPALKLAAGRLGATLGAVVLLGLVGLLAGIAVIAPLAALSLVAGPVAVLLGIVSVLTLLVVSVAGIYLIPPVAVVEGRGPVATLGRCLWVLRRRFWRVVGVTLLMVLLVLLITVALTLPLAFLAPLAGPGAWVVDGVASTLGSLVSVPLVTAAALLLYLDARVRVEGYDLELRARGLGSA